jgi:Tfp pilus assembly protein PilO
VKDEQQPKNAPWQLIAVAAGACLALTIAACALGVRPLIERRAQESAQRETLQQRREAASRLAGEVADLQRHLNADKEVLARTPVRLQPATLVNQRLEAVTRLATECGLSLDEVRPGNAVDSTHFQRVPIRIVGGGEYPACATFLRKLRKTFGDMGVNQFMVSNVNAAIPSPNPAASFQAELVWFTELPRK